MRAPRPSDAKRLLIQQYQFLDDLSFVRNPADVLDKSEKDELQKFIVALATQFKKAGWEGDGEIGLIWLPPFVDVGVEDTWGTYVWHVKQSNNGTSWLASDTSLDFKRLREQNEHLGRGDRVPVGIMFTACNTLQKRVLRVISNVSRQLKALPTRPIAIMTEIQEELTQAAQGGLVSQLNYFLDDCYLEVLQEVLDFGNTSRLRLGKFKANLSPMTYIPELAEETAGTRDAESGQWFTIKGLISDIWQSYKFEPFKQKTEMLFKACEYKVDAGIHSSIMKHVLLRNCIQHHERQVTADALRQAGLKEFTVLRRNRSTMKLGVGARISFPLAELVELAKQLDTFAMRFDAHTRTRIRSLHWVSSSWFRDAVQK